MAEPTFTLDDVRYSEGQGMYARAQELFDSGKVTNFQPTAYGYAAVVRGSSRPWPQVLRITASHCK